MKNTGCETLMNQQTPNYCLLTRVISAYSILLPHYCTKNKYDLKPRKYV